MNDNAQKDPETNEKPEIPEGWEELAFRDIIATDDRIWDWGRGPWKDVGGSLIGCRYNVPNAEVHLHWTIIRQKRPSP